MSRVLLQDIVENIRFDDLPVNWTVFIPITFNLEISINSKFPGNSAACAVQFNRTFYGRLRAVKTLIRYTAI